MKEWKIITLAWGIGRVALNNKIRSLGAINLKSNRSIRYLAGPQLGTIQDYHLWHSGVPQDPGGLVGDLDS